MKIVIERISKDEIKNFKKKWPKEKKIIWSNFFDFSFFEKKKKDFYLALKFIDLPQWEEPDFKDLKKNDFFWINKKNKIEDFLKRKIIYSFTEENYFKELREIFELSYEKKKNIFKNIFFEIEVEEFNLDEIYKKITFLRKKFLLLDKKKEFGEINILIRNNFSDQENKILLSDKLLKISGVIIEKNEKK